MAQLDLDLGSPEINIAIPFEIKFKDSLVQAMAAMLLVVRRAGEQAEKEERANAERQDNQGNDLTNQPSLFQS